MTVISAEEKARRKRGIDEARASVRLEGYIIGPEQEALAERFIAGEMTSKEFTAAGIALAEQQFAKEKREISNG